MAATRARSVRVADEVWIAALVRARNEGTTVTDVIVKALREYVTPKHPAQ